MSPVAVVPTSEIGRAEDSGNGLTTSVADYDRNKDPGSGRLAHGNAHEGVEFFERLRQSDGYWEISKIEAPGYFHFFIPTETHNIDGELNGVLMRRGARPGGTMRVAQPDDTIRGSGTGPVRCLQVSMTRKALWNCSIELGIQPGGLELRDLEPRSDLAITHWMRTHVQGY
jgi:hypothetical protein